MKFWWEAQTFEPLNSITHIGRIKPRRQTISKLECCKKKNNVNLVV